MEPIQLFQLAARQTRYLSTSQAVIADNVSNANTPGFKARAVKPFSEVLDHTGLTMAATNQGHIAPSAADAEAVAGVTEQDPWETAASGNSVNLEQEMIKAGEVNRTFSLNTQLVKAFQGMLVASVRS